MLTRYTEQLTEIKLSFFNSIFKDRNASKNIDLEKEIIVQKEQIAELSMSIRKLFELNVELVKELENVIKFINSKHQPYKHALEKDEDFYN